MRERRNGSDAPPQNLDSALEEDVVFDNLKLAQPLILSCFVSCFSGFTFRGVRSYFRANVYSTRAEGAPRGFNIFDQLRARSEAVQGILALRQNDFLFRFGQCGLDASVFNFIFPGAMVRY